MLPDDIPNPLELLQHDRMLARERGDTMAEFGCFATTDAGGQPHARFVTIREIEATGITFWASGTSPKVRHLELNGRYELTTYWPTVARQYRLQGLYEWIPASAEPARYMERPWRAKVWDWMYEEHPESTPVPDRNIFVGRYESLSLELEHRFGGRDGIQPSPNAGLVRLVAHRVEVQEIDAEQRLHDRRLFLRDGDRWSATLLIP